MKVEHGLVDLFAGCGGLSLGLEEAGFYPIFVNELNADAMNSYLLNRKAVNPLLAEKYKVHNVKDLVLKEGMLDDVARGFKRDYGINATKKKSEVDLVVGGPPCQGFSGIGHRRSYSVDKTQLPSNHLYEDMLCVVSKLRPRIFLFENVRGLLSARWTKEGSKGEIWNDIQKEFKENLPDYHIRHKLVYAKDYGVPQNRPRVLMVGVRHDLGIEPRGGADADAVEAGFLPFPVGGAPGLVELLGDLEDPGYVNGGVTEVYPHKAMSEIQKALRTNPYTGVVSRKGAPLLEQEYSKHSPDIVKKFKYMIEHGGKIPPSMKTKKFAQRVLPRDWGDNGPTITATSLPDDYVHYSQPRSLTVREWARLQLFPDSYQFAGKRTTGGLRRAGNPREGLHDREVPKYTQIGNAVPVGLARHVGEHFMKLIKNAKC